MRIHKNSRRGFCVDHTEAGALVAVCILVSLSFAEAQIESGTVIVVGYSKQKVVIAADSREGNTNGGYRDEACKIAELSDKLVFAATGRAKKFQNGSAVWDATREAATALLSTQRLNGEKAGQFFDRVAGAWGQLMAEEIAANIGPKDGMKLFDNEHLVEGIFMGIDESSELHFSHGIVRAKIVDNVPKIAMDQVTAVGAMREDMNFAATGEDDIFKEFQTGSSLRSKKWRNGIHVYMKRHNLHDRDAAKCIFIVELTGLYGKDRIFNNPTIHLAGGPTDAIELTPGAGLHWIQRKSHCPER